MKFFSGMKDEYRDSLSEENYVGEFINLFFKYKFPSKQKLNEVVAPFIEEGDSLRVKHHIQ